MRTPLLLITIMFFGCGSSVSVENAEGYENRRTKAEEGVSDWIKKNALYPESYEPVLFSDFSESYSSRHDEKIPNRENYIIRHVHKLLSKDSVIDTFDGYFIMEHDYYVSIIETERSSATGGAFPPKTAVWMDKFGRQLNKQDSLSLQERRGMVTGKFIKEMREGLKSGDMEIEDFDEEEFIKILDTLEKKK